MNYPFLTSKERDVETGLDYFLARYYGSVQGRFTSPDEFSGGPDELFDFADDASENPTFYADITNPQSLNKYQYTYNNPLNMTDDDGHCPICAAVFEVAGTVWDGYETYKSWKDPNASTAEKVLTTIGTVAGVALPGGGYTAGAKRLIKSAVKKEATQAVAKKADNAVEAVVDTSKTINKTDDAARVTPKIPKDQRVKTPTAKQRQTVYEKNQAKNAGQLKCDICGGNMERAQKSKKGVSRKPNEATIDHITPRSRGGTNDPSNLRGACLKCNRAKSDND